MLLDPLSTRGKQFADPTDPPASEDNSDWLPESLPDCVSDGLWAADGHLGIVKQGDWPWLEVECRQDPLR